MKINNYILLLLLFILNSCTTRKIQHFTDTKLVIKDSISVIETIHYDTVVIAGDTLIQTFTVECDSVTNKPKPYQVRQKNGRSSQSVTIDSKGILTAECKTDSLINIIANKDREIAIYKAREYSSDDFFKFFKIQYRIPKWAWYSLITNGMLVIWIFRKPLIRLIRLAFI